MWKSFWANPGSKDACALSTNQRMSLLAKAVAPQLDYPCSRWPPQKVIAQEVDCMQRKMVSTLLKTPRYPDGEAADFIRRRGRLAAGKCREVGQWSHRWFRRALDWNEHLERPRNGCSWASSLFHYTDRQWFIARCASLLDERLQWFLHRRQNGDKSSAWLRACTLARRHRVGKVLSSSPILEIAIGLMHAFS